MNDVWWSSVARFIIFYFLFFTRPIITATTFIIQHLIQPTMQRPTVQQDQDSKLSTLRDIKEEIEYFVQLRKANPTASVPYTARELKVQIKFCRDENKRRWAETSALTKDDTRYKGTARLHSYLYSAYSHMHSGNKNKYTKANKKYKELASEMMDGAMDECPIHIVSGEGVLYEGNDEAVRLFCNEMMLELLVLDTIESKLDLIGYW